GVHKGESIEPLSRSGNNPRNFEVRDRVVGMERCEQDRAVNARLLCTVKVLLQRRICVPRARQTVAFSRVAVTIDDHCTACDACRAWVNILSTPSRPFTGSHTLPNCVFIACMIWVLR